MIMIKLNRMMGAIFRRASPAAMSIVVSGRLAASSPVREPKT